MSDTEAIELALRTYRQRPRSLHRQQLPAGILSLIKIAAGDENAIERGAAGATKRGLPIEEAAVFYLQLALTQARDDYRRLGLKPGASLQELKDHKRWLLKWLHPDRNKNAWESALFQRVAAAAERLETAIRSGKPAAVAPPPPRRSSRRFKRSGWRISRTRFARISDWRPRFKKAVLALIALIMAVGTAQALLSERDDFGLRASISSLWNDG